jgi:DNA-binding CsgD family transcriptional regulator
MNSNTLFNTTLETIYDAALSPAIWPSALQSIADCFDDVGTLLLYGRDDGGFGYIESTALHGMIDRFFQSYHGEDFRAVRGVERGVFLSRDALTDRHIVTEEEIETHPFYVALAGFGFKYFATIPICQDFRMVAGVAVQRSVGKHPFTDAELETLTRLGRHVERAFRLSVRLLDAELVKEGLGEALGRLNMGVFVLDSLGRITFVNACGKRLIGDGLAVVEDRLWLQSPSAREALEAAVNREFWDDDGSSANTRPIQIDRVQTERPLTVYVLPISTQSTSYAEFLTHARAIVLVIDPKVGDPPDPGLVRDALGLTLGEARLAALIGSGTPPRDAAGRLGITEETARTVLKRLFVKLGISRQSELSALMTRLVLR